MQEYVSEAVVLDREPSGELDDRFAIFTKKFGKLVAKGKSTKKIVSKLSGHLQPGNLITARLIEKNGLQIVDALKFSRLQAAPADLYFLHLILAEGEPDQRLWQMLLDQEFSWPQILKILGWDPAETLCDACGQKPPAAFSVQGQEFFCEGCASKSGQNGLIYLSYAGRSTN